MFYRRNNKEANLNMSMNAGWEKLLDPKAFFDDVILLF